MVIFGEMSHRTQFMHLAKHFMPANAAFLTYELPQNCEYHIMIDVETEFRKLVLLNSKDLFS